MPPTEYIPSFWPKVTDQWVWGIGNGPDIHGWESEAGSCVANALCTMKEVHEYRQYGYTNRYSIGWIFGNRTTQEDNPNDGMIVNYALDRLKYDGVPLYKSLPENRYNGWGEWTYPDTYMYYDWTDGGTPIIGAETLVANNANREMYKAKISSYSVMEALGPDPVHPGEFINIINATQIESLKQSIIDNGVVLVTTYVANNFQDLGGAGCDGVVPANVDQNIVIGETKTSHVMCIIGWKLIDGITHWIVHNNWGDWWWGEYISPNLSTGRCYMPLYYENIIRFITVTDDLSEQNCPAPESCIYTIDSQLSQYINTSATIDYEIGTLAFDKKLNYGPYANIWRGADLYAGAEQYHDIESMTQGQTVQFRARYVDVKPWLIQTSGGEAWGWAYSPTYTRVRPSTFAWTHTPSYLNPVALTAVEWNAFLANINLVRVYKGLSEVTFTQAYKGTVFSASIFNQARTAISDMQAMSMSQVSSGTQVYASFLNLLVSDLNSIT